MNQPDLIGFFTAKKTQPEKRVRDEVLEGAPKYALVHREPSSNASTQDESPECPPRISALLISVLHKSMPALSGATTIFLEKLQLKKDPRPEMTAEEILNSPSVKEKHAELLERGRALPLPIAYKHLLCMFEKTDRILNVMKLNRVPTTFRTLKNSLEIAENVCLEKLNLQQFLRVYGRCYVLNCGETGISIDFPSELQNLEPNVLRAAFNKRRADFRKNLIGIVKVYHSEFLTGLGCTAQEDPENTGNWHTEFPLHTVPDIEPHMHSPAEKSIEFPIEKPHRMRREEKRVDRLLKLCGALKEIYRFQRTPSLFQRELIKKLRNATSEDSNAASEDPNILETDLAEILALFGHWFSKIATNSGAVIRMNKQKTPDNPSIRARLTEKYA